MKVVIFDTGEVSDVPTSCLNWCADELIGVAFSGWFHDLAKPDEIPATPAEAPFPVLSPTTLILDPNVWLMPVDGYARPTDSRRVAFANPQDFTRVFGRLPRPPSR